MHTHIHTHAPCPWSMQFTFFSRAWQNTANHVNHRSGLYIYTYSHRTVYSILICNFHAACCCICFVQCMHAGIYSNSDLVPCEALIRSKCQGMQSFSDPPFRDYQGTHILPSCRNPRGYQGATFQHHPGQDATQVKQGPSRSTRHMFSRIHTSVESHSAEWSTVPTMGIWCSHTL